MHACVWACLCAPSAGRGVDAAVPSSTVARLLGKGHVHVGDGARPMVKRCVHFGQRWLWDGKWGSGAHVGHRWLWEVRLRRPYVHVGNGPRQMVKRCVYFGQRSRW
eukprot:227399-Pleurochrysis_carterae.AAC.1